MKRVFIVALLLLAPLSSHASAQSPPDATDDRLESFARLDAIAGYVQRRLADDVYDLEGVARLIGATPEDVVHFVRENTAYRPYWGALKGGAGVLLDRTGNALDLSLLVARLLEAQGKDVRIGYALLDQSDGSRVLALAQQEIPVVAPTLEIDPELLAVFLKDGGLSRADLQEIVRTTATGAAELRTTSIESTSAFLGSVATGLGDQVEFLTPPQRDGDMEAMAQEYFWAEVRMPDGSWGVLEPLPLELVGQLRAGAEYFGINDLPEQLVHEVTVAAHMRRADDSQVVLAGITLTSRQGVLAPIEMANTPVLDGPASSANEAFGISDEAPETIRFSIGLSGQEYAFAVYRSDGSLVSQGSVSEKTAAGLGEIGRQITGLGGVGSTPAAEDPGGELRGLDVSYTVSNSRGMSAPRQVYSVTRRVIPRGEYALIDTNEIGFAAPWHARLSIIPFSVNPTYIDHRNLQSDLMVTRALAAVGRGEALPAESVPAATVFHASPAHRTAMLARELIRELHGGAAPFADQMALVVQEIGIFPSGSAPAVTNSIDLVQIAGSMGPGVRPDNGLTWTIAEALALQQETDQHTEGFAERFGSLILSAGLTIAPITDTTTALRYQDRLAGALLEEVEAGRLSLVLSHYGTGVYLSRDPYTGLVIGRMPGGRGESALTRVITEAKTISLIKNIRTFSSLLEFSSHTAEFIVCLTSVPPDHRNRAFEVARCSIFFLANASGMLNVKYAAAVTGLLTAECIAREPKDYRACLVAGAMGAGGSLGSKGAKRLSWVGTGAEIASQLVGAAGKIALAKRSRDRSNANN